MGAVSSLFIRILVFGFAVNFKLLKITWEFSFWHCLLLLLCVNTRVFCETNFYYRMKKGVGARSLCVFPLWLRLELIIIKITTYTNQVYAAIFHQLRGLCSIVINYQVTSNVYNFLHLRFNLIIRVKSY